MGSTSNRSDAAEDALLRARVEDACRLAADRGYPCFVGFLDERGRGVAEAAIAHCGGVNALFWGGHEEAERTILGVFPDFLPPDPAAFPLLPIGFSFRAQAALSHRDFLGTLLSCGIRRDKLGDILCGQGIAVVFVREELVPFLCEQVTRVGGEGVSAVVPFEGELPVAHSFRERTDTVASPRLDAVLRICIGCSREEAARRIAAGLVMVNHRLCESVSAEVREGDLFSVRGEGRFLLEKIGPPTKKGRLFVRIQQYI